MSDEPSKQDLENSPDKPEQGIGGDQSEDNIDILKQAMGSSWPEIQKHLQEEARKEHNYQVDEDGREYYIDDKYGKVYPVNFDEWWLKDFIREDVLMELPGVCIFNTQPSHVDSVVISLRRAYGLNRYGHDDSDEDVFTEDDILAHIQRFPQGQFAAQRISGPNAGNCVGMATTMRASRPPTAPILPWMEAIGGLCLGQHEADGEWLYGVEMAVHPSYRRQGIGKALYEARFQLARRLGLRGWYAVGMLMGYQKYADNMRVAEYGEKVIRGELKDPTVTMQMNRGFRAVRVVTDYCDEPAAGDAGVLIVWENPDYES